MSKDKRVASFIKQTKRFKKLKIKGKKDYLQKCHSCLEITQRTLNEPLTT